MPNKLRLIVFFIPPEKLVNGGIMSIFSIAKVSRDFKEIHGAEVVLSTYPGTKSYKKNDLFKNNEVVYSFDEIVKKGNPDYLLLNVPEYASIQVYSSLKKYKDYLESIKDLRVNILTQNILLMQTPAEVASWFSLTDKVTQTTAHDRYASQEIADLYSLPTHHLSIFTDPQQYERVAYPNKKNIIALSPDIVDEKESIVSKLKKQLPEYKIITIQNMKYEDYKKLIADAKFVITFGEGFDCYFIESFFSGSVAFAVYNNDFFPDISFRDLRNTYDNYAFMEENLVNDIRTLDERKIYEDISSDNFSKITHFYDFSNYRENIKKFYLGNYTYLHSPLSRTTLITRIIEDKNKTIKNKDESIQALEKQLSEKDEVIKNTEKIISDRDKLIEEIYKSTSWKATKPLRKISSSLKKEG